MRVLTSSNKFKAVSLSSRGANRLEGGAGNDTLVGRGAGDLSVFRDGWGNDMITDFADGSDIIDLTGVTGLDNFAQLGITDVAVGVEVAFGGQTIILTGITSGQLTGQDFLL